MQRRIRKYIAIVIFILVLIDMCIGFLLQRSRSFSHLAIWDIIESGKEGDFYWQPKDAPHYFRFEPDSEKLSIFRHEVYPLVKNETDELKIMLTVGKYISQISANNIRPYLSLKWDSPERLLMQIKDGAWSNCFHRAILFSTCLSSLGIKSRLWALENEKFNGLSHSVNEVYIGSLRKWVFVDTLFGFYISKDKTPLSFIEFRDELLKGTADRILIHSIDNKIKGTMQLPDFYRRLIKCVFLRAGNDFINKYNSRYGTFFIFQRYLDKFPDNIKMGLDYLFGRRDIFIHYVDGSSKSLRPGIIIAKLFFYFMVSSAAAIGIVLAITFSRRITRQR